MKSFALALVLSLPMLAGTARAAETDWMGERAASSSREALELAVGLTPALPPLAHERSWIKQSLIRSGKQVQEAMRHASVPRSLY